MTANNADTAAHLRFLATVKRQSAPPRCNPFAIVIQVLALGMIFIGLTMTIIAHWPGSTSIGENPLKIAGPILLAVGFVVFVIGIVIVCILNRKERRRWDKTIAHMAATRPTADEVEAPEARPSSMKPAVTGSEPGRQPFTYEDDPVNSRAAPYGYGDGRRPPPPGDVSAEDNVFGDGEAVPDPVRVTKSRRKKKGDESGSVEELTAEGGAGAARSHSKEKVTEETTTTTTVTTTTHAKRRAKADEAAAAEEERRALMRDDDDFPLPPPPVKTQPSPSPGEQRRLRVHVKAQPGATVRIHQGAPPAVAPKPAFTTQSKANTSGETDI